MSETTITGLDEFYRQLQAFPVNLEKNVMRGAIRAGLKPIADEAKLLCPVGKTQALRLSIRVKFKNRSQQYGWVRGQITAGNATAYYAHIVEFGSGSYYEGTGSKSKRAPYEIKPKGAKSLFFAGLMRELIVHPGVKPQAFMRRAVDSRTSDALEALRVYLAERIPKEFAKRS